jgi:hypothetical protein
MSHALKGRDRMSPAGSQKRKEHVLTRGQSSMTRGIGEAVVIKGKNLCCLTESGGSVPIEDGHGFGLYYHDCRLLDGYEMKIDGARPTELVCTAAQGFIAVIELTNPDLQEEVGERRARAACWRLLPRRSWRGKSIAGVRRDLTMLGRRLEWGRARAQDACEGLLADGFLAEQHLHDLIQLRACGGQELTDALVACFQQVLHVLVDAGCRGLAIVSPLCEVVAEERLDIVGFKCHQA